MDYTPILAKNFDVSKIRYGPLKKSPVGSKSVYINYGGDKCVIQFPLMHVPYGLSDSSSFNKDKKDAAPNYTMNISFKGIEDNKAVSVLYTKLQEIEDKIKSDVYVNRVTWLNDRYDDMETVVSRLFSSNIQLDKDKETKKVLNRYPPTFRVKAPSVSETRDDGSVVTTFKFDSSDLENNELNFADIINKIKGAKVQLIVHLMGLWFAGGKYGCTWKILSGRFQVARSVKYAYVPDSDDESSKKEADDDDEEEIEADHHAEAVTPPVKTQVAPSDDEEEEEEAEEEEETEEVPPPPPPKKAVSKKTTKK